MYQKALTQDTAWTRVEEPELCTGRPHFERKHVFLHTQEHHPKYRGDDLSDLS